MSVNLILKYCWYYNYLQLLLRTPIRGITENSETLIARYAFKIKCNSEWLYRKGNNPEIQTIASPSGGRRKTVAINTASITNKLEKDNLEINNDLLLLQNDIYSKRSRM